MNIPGTRKDELYCSNPSQERSRVTAQFSDCSERIVGNSETFHKRVSV
jgi:hypothetical protein